MDELRIALPNGFAMRPADLEDAEPVAAVLNACSVELVGGNEWEAHELDTDWRSPIFDLEADSRVVVAPDGNVVAYADIFDQAPHVRLYAMGQVHPAYRNRGIGTALSRWLEARGRNAMAEAPAGTRVALLQHTLSTDALAAELLQRQGYVAVRRAYRMVIEMNGTPPEPAVPDGLAIRPFVRGQEERATLTAVRDAFRDHWGYVERPFEESLQDWVHWMENDPDYDPSLWFLAMDDGKIAGMSLCYPKTTEDPEMGWVATLGVRRPWRRRGLALALLHHSFREFYRRGQRKVGLGVDAQSLTGATRLYERAGMHVARQFLTYEKELRPGAELSTQALQE